MDGRAIGAVLVFGLGCFGAGMEAAALILGRADPALSAVALLFIAYGSCVGGARLIALASARRTRPSE